MKLFTSIELTVKGNIAYLYFNRPSQLNAMNSLMMDEIIEALNIITSSSELKVAVLSGKGRAFMAGADIKEYSAQSPQEFEQFQNRGTTLYKLIENAPIPVIAAINGFALGGGFEIALACDMIIADENAKLGLPEIHLGLIPGGGGTQRLLYKIGVNRTKEILMLGQPIPATQLFDWGIINIISKSGEFDITVEHFAEKLSRRPTQSIKAIKKLLQPEFLEKSFNERLIVEKEMLLALFYTPISKKLISVFAAKGNKESNSAMRDSAAFSK